MDINKVINEFCQGNNIEINLLDIQDFISYQVNDEQLIPLLKFLKTNPELRFTILSDLFATDFPERERRFEVIYSLLSMQLNKRIIIKTAVAEDIPLPTATSIFSSACWYEREIFDMFGIEFNGSPDQRRILTDYGFKGHPLRKDFPVTGHVEVTYDKKLEQVIYEPVVLDHEFRKFDFVSPWQGPGEYVLPGDEKATK
ncbi:MAG: NADH-quinone oxidoreductase subunit C [Rickettsiaceae bacterium]|nr:NADH-quinone oxidoreductase subunit C [Rickettsiaceae bacterium]